MFDSDAVLQAWHDALDDSELAICEAARRAVSLLDLTSLNEKDTPDVIADLCQRAQTPAGPVAAVCVYPRFVAQAAAALQGTGIGVATVVNFPGGDEPIDDILQTTRSALDAGADEIDIVLPYRAYLDGRQAQAIAPVKAVCALCRDVSGSNAGSDGGVKARVKVILETGRLQDADVILSASRDAIAAGVDFLKTSTGKIDINATPEACVAMLQAIAETRDAGGRKVGLKVSGGVRSTQDAARYLALADAAMGNAWVSAHTFRFGASSLLDALLTTIDG